MEKRFATVMHEIRNPLGVINLHAALIRKNPEIALSSAEIIQKTSLELEKILSELINHSKPTTVEEQEVNLEEAIIETLNLIKPSFINKNVRIAYGSSLEGEITVAFDKTKFRQVLFNLLKNALEASNPNDKVKILLENQQNDIYLKISDQGSGILPENRKKIFEPWFTTKTQGTGLGLAESRNIIESYGGRLYIDPNEEKGTTFVIKLKGSKNGYTRKKNDGNIYASNGRTCCET